MVVATELSIASGRSYASITVTVKTGVSNVNDVYSKTVKYEETNPASSSYINPTGQFNSELTVNASKMVTNITFIQK